ncbi:MAG: exodeoxyribonuclease III [Spirochaetales bacterium]|jgi:exodeoxyribonuclease III|nr:exodeoxyribonuclease III [Spirochaetales bacterium]
MTNNRSIISWNVNGIRAAQKKGLIEWLTSESPDFLCLQETKAEPGQLDEQLMDIEGYAPFFMSAEKKGYSGVSIYSKETPLQVSPLGYPEFDSEGRTLMLDFDDFSLISAYFPNSQYGGARLSYKLDYCEAMFGFCKDLAAKRRNFVLCGDFNIAHKPIDLARPKANEQTPGYLPEERAWMDMFINNGFVDTFRIFNKEPNNYTWWSYRMQAREKNIGWRLDYHCVPEYFQDSIISSKILKDVLGSDHCPIRLTLRGANFDENTL